MPRHATATSYGAETGNKGGHGKKGRSGPRTKSFKHFLANCRNDPRAQKALLDAMQDPDSRGFAAAWKHATEYDDEKPAEKQQIVGPVEVHVKMVREGRRLTAG